MRLELEEAREELEAMSCSKMAFGGSTGKVVEDVDDGVEEAGVEGGGVG